MSIFTFEPHRSHRHEDVYRPLGPNAVYALPTIEATGVTPPAYLQSTSQQHLPARINIIQQLQNTVSDRYESTSRPDMTLIRCLGAVSPTVYEARVNTLTLNLRNGPLLLGIAVEHEDWELCKDIVIMHLIPGYLQTRVDGAWKDCATLRAALWAGETCWTAMWHVLVARMTITNGIHEVITDDVGRQMEQTFRHQIDLVLRALIIKCRDITSADDTGRTPCVGSAFYFYLLDITARWIAENDAEPLG